MRIGDAERDAVLGVLQNAYGAGQLTLEEFDERQQYCLKARYIDDLSALVVDLPEGAGWHHAVTRPANPAVPRDAAVRNEIELSLSSIMGGHNVYVPEGVRVIDQSVNIMAGVDVSDEAGGNGSNGTLIIKGFNFWGGTSVQLRKSEK